MPIRTSWSVSRLRPPLPLIPVQDFTNDDVALFLSMQVCLTAAAQMMINDLSRAKNKHILWETGPLCNSHTYMGVVLNEFMETMDEANRGSPLTSKS